MMTMTAQDETDRSGTADRSGTTVQTHAPTPSKATVPSGGTSGTSPSFTPRWGRISAALVGLLALAAALVTLVLGAFGIVSLLVPLACVAVATGAVALLRFLAIRGRAARVNRAFAAAMAPVRETAAAPEVPIELVTPVAPRRPTSLFDAEESGARRLSPMELRTAALAVAHGSSVVDVRAELLNATGTKTTEATETSEASETSGSAGSTAWAPVEVPRPTYVDAAKAERQAPAPLDLPEAPKPTTRTPIKASEAAARVAAEADDASDESANPAPSTGRINLDDVLQRRRA
jgi:hypothetical protein